MRASRAIALAVCAVLLPWPAPAREQATAPISQGAVIWPTDP